MIHGVLEAIILGYFLHETPKLAIGIALSLSFSHCIIDLVKNELIKRYPKLEYNVVLFLGDQVLHLIIIMIAYLVITVVINNSGSGFMVLKEILNGDFGYSKSEKFLTVLLLIIIGLWVVGIFIGLFIDSIKQNGKRLVTDQKLENGGFLIGLLERAIIISAMALDIVSVIGFLITVKSIARFKKFDDDDFVEYFIIGSFMSLFSGVVVGYLIHTLLN